MASKLNITLINTYSLATLGVVDLSDYTGTPTNNTLEVTISGTPKVALTFVANSVNIFHAGQLVQGTEGDALPDGLYILRYSIFPNSSQFLEKTFLRTALIECDYNRLLLSLDNQCGCDLTLKKELKYRLRDIKMLISAGISAANICQPETAFQFYQKAVKLMDKFTLCNC